MGPVLSRVSSDKVQKGYAHLLPSVSLTSRGETPHAPAIQKARPHDLMLARRQPSDERYERVMVDLEARDRASADATSAGGLADSAAADSASTWSLGDSAASDAASTWGLADSAAADSATSGGLVNHFDCWGCFWGFCEKSMCL